jgi:NAD(P)-dependent dehydrogenase (short-subunit alcohol dehydrogenase family)
LRLVVLASTGHRGCDVDLGDPHFERTPYDPRTAYSRSKTANILFAVGFDRRHRARGVRATAVHPGVIKTELDRHMNPGEMDRVVKQINAMSAAAGHPPFHYKTVRQGAATSIWAACVAKAEDIGGRYCENCQVSQVIYDSASPMSPGVMAYAINPEHAQALWTKSEEMVGEHF